MARRLFLVWLSINLVFAAFVWSDGPPWFAIFGAAMGTGLGFLLVWASLRGTQPSEPRPEG